MCNNMVIKINISHHIYLWSKLKRYISHHNNLIKIRSLPWSPLLILCDVWDPRNLHYRWYLNDIISRIDNDMIKKSDYDPFSAMCLFVACLIYVICVCLRIVVPNTYCVVFLFCFISSCVPHIVSFSGLSIFDCPFDIL